MKLLKKIPLWFLSGILYGLSWPIFEGINLSFLAWFAFVPLFVFLEKNKNKFLKSMFASYGAMVVFGTFSAFWLFNFPASTLKVAIIFFLEEFWFFIPFLIFFPIQKKLGFQKALWLFPFIWMLWEWIYLDLEFTMGTHLSAYSQSNNLWLIQYIEISGMWGVSFWLLFFNVLIYKAYKKENQDLKNTQFYKKIVIISIFMLGIPLIYSFFSYYKYDNLEGKKINVTVVPTDFSARYLLSANNTYKVVEQTLYKTDAFAFALKDKNQNSDLYLWPETGLPFTMQETNLKDLLLQATKDWQSALLTGGRGIVDTLFTKDKRQYASGILISYKEEQPKYHHKTVLTPQEAIPYHNLLEKIPKFPIQLTDERFFKKGKDFKPLKLTTKRNKVFSVGVSLCYEQWHPKLWATLSRNGADFFTQLSAEGWYGNVGFMTFMANVTKIRCIENRKQAARSSNFGISGVINQMGSLTKTLQPRNISLTALRNVTFYAKHANLFPQLCFVLFIILLILNIFKFKNN